jgi:hypothetical protein
MVQTLAQNQRAQRMRVYDYLCACGLPEDLAQQWNLEFTQQPLLVALTAARQRFDAYQAHIPMPVSVPAPAVLDMPLQAIPLRSLNGLIDSACRECLPWSRRLSMRFHTWIRQI